MDNIGHAQKIWWQFTQSYTVFDELTVDHFDIDDATLTEIKTAIQEYGTLLISAHDDASDYVSLTSAVETGCFHCLHRAKGDGGIDPQVATQHVALCLMCGIDGLVSLDALPNDPDIRDAFLEDMEDIWFDQRRDGAGRPERHYSVDQIRQYKAKQ